MRRGLLRGSRQFTKLIAYVPRSLHAVTRIFFKTAAHDAGKIAWQIWAHVGDGRRSITQNRRDQLRRRIPPERPPTSCHFVQQHAQRKNIGAMVEWTARSLFRRHVRRRAHAYAYLRPAV